MGKASVDSQEDGSMTIHNRTKQIQAAEDGMRELIWGNECDSPERAARHLRIALDKAQEWHEAEAIPPL